MSHQVDMVQPAGRAREDESSGSSLQELEAKEAAAGAKAPEAAAGDYNAASYKDIAKEFSLMGWTAFGGPAAHVGMFEKVGGQAHAMRGGILPAGTLLTHPT